jgi:rhomboid protease GluP
MKVHRDPDQPSPEQPPGRQRPLHPLEQPPLPAPAPAPHPVVRRRVDLPTNPPVLTYLLIAINVVVFLLDMATNWSLTDLGAKDNAKIILGEYWRFFTPMFLHGGILHLGLNSYFLYIVGPQVERSYGSLRFAAIYFLSGFAGSIASFALTPSPSIGASGALFGVIGALIPLLYRNRDVLGNTRRQITSIVEVIAVNLLIGFLVPDIDNWGHVGGLLGGLALSWLATPRYKIRSVDETYVRIDDISSPAVAWTATVVVGGVLVTLAMLLIWLKSRYPAIQ